MVEVWEATLQNWQSEFLAVGSFAILAVYLRQRGSPESKPVGAPTGGATGEEGWPRDDRGNTCVAMSGSDQARLGIDGVIEWRDEEGELHRDGGPAAVYPDGRRIWFIEGEEVREERSARQPSLVKAR